MRTPERTDGFAPIEDYAAIGDGRSLALVSLDGSIDWLCLPDLDSASVFAALLDPERGGRFVLRPTGDFEAQRRYADDSNVLETVFTTPTGTVKVTEAFLTDGGALLPWTEIVRKVDCIDGEVELEWRVAARPRWGRDEPRAQIREDVAVVEWDHDALAILNYDCGDSKTDGPDVHGRWKLSVPSSSLLAVLYFNDAPWAIPPRAELEARLDRTLDYWQTYTREIPYEGPWPDAVRRSVLVQRLLTFPHTGAIAAAGTTSLPERIGGDRNWDYRFSWVRDTSLALESLLAVRLSVECERSLAWVSEAAQQNDRLHPVYTLRAEANLPRENLALSGYRGSRPVRVGNDAEEQLQLGTYADAIDAAYRFCGAGHILDSRTMELCARLASDVCRLWSEDDAGIWEIEPRPYTESKIACWAALDHAIELADQGRLPHDDTKRWKRSRKEIRAFIEERCWSETRAAYTICAGSEDLDASLLLGARFGFFEPGDERFAATIAAIRDELGVGPFLYRTTELRGQEGCFLACSFWLVDALARDGRVEEAKELMDELLASASDAGLYSEQIDPATGAHLGNTPQALSHLSLMLAAVSVMRAERAAV
jgi:GH15 family glucan-1,4-alpha-glucosidase